MTRAHLLAPALLAALLAFACKSEPKVSTRTLTQYNTHCAHCHDTGAANAPKRGEAQAWEKRLRKGKPALVKSIKKGPVAMPAGGGCDDCSDEDFVALIDYLAAE